jgi:hypothetical protein
MFRKLCSLGNAPKCIKCGHEPCPACETWCDLFVKNIYCPKCVKDPKATNHGIMRQLQDGDKDGDLIECKCGHQWKLDTRIDDGDVDIDPCCDGECEWDQPMAQVIKWCEKARGK